MADIEPRSPGDCRRAKSGRAGSRSPRGRSEARARSTSNGVAMRAVDLEPSSGEPPVILYDTSGPYTDPDVDRHHGRACPSTAVSGSAPAATSRKSPSAKFRPEDNGQLGPDRQRRRSALPERPQESASSPSRRQRHANALCKARNRHSGNGICGGPRESRP